MMLQMPAFPVTPVTSDGGAPARSAAAAQQVPSNGIPAATTEFVKPSPNSQQTSAEQRHAGLDPKEKAAVERANRRQGDGNPSHGGGGNPQPRAPRYGYHQDPPNNLSELTVGKPPVYRFHRTPDGNLYALSGRQAGELAPVPGDSTATIHKMRLVGAKASSAPLQTSRMMSQLASFQGKAASSVVISDRQRAAVAKHERTQEAFTDIASGAKKEAKAVRKENAENVKEIERLYKSTSEAKTEVKRAEFKQKLKTAKVATVDDKVRVRNKLPKIRSVVSAERKVAAFKKAAVPKAEPKVAKTAAPKVAQATPPKTQAAA